MRKKIAFVTIIFSLFVISILYWKDFSTYNFFDKLLACPWAKIVYWTSNVFGKRFILGVLISEIILFTIVPSLRQLEIYLLRLFSETKNMFDILLYGHSANIKNSEINKQLSVKDRNYQRFFYYLKLKEIPLFKIILYPIIGFYLTFALRGIMQISKDFGDFNMSLFWIKNVTKSDPFYIIPILYIGVLIYNIYSKIKSKNLKKQKIDWIDYLSYLLYVPIGILCFKNVLIGLLGITMMIIAIVKTVLIKKKNKILEEIKNDTTRNTDSINESSRSR